MALALPVFVGDSLKLRTTGHCLLLPLSPGWPSYDVPPCPFDGNYTMTSLQASRAIVATLAFGFLFGAPGWATAEVLAKEADALPVAQLAFQWVLLAGNRETDCRKNLPGSCVAGPRPCDCICGRSQLSCHVSQSAAPVYQRLSVRTRAVGGGAEN